MKPLAVRLLVTALSLVAVIRATAELAALSEVATGPRLPGWIIVMQEAVALTAGALALFLAWRAADRADTRTLALHLGFLAVGYATLVPVAPSSAWLDSVVFGVSGAFAVTMFIRFTLLFPKSLSPDQIGGGKRPGIGRLRAALARRPGCLWWVGLGYAALWLAFTWTRNADASQLLQAAAFVSIVLAFTTGIALGLSYLLTGYRLATPTEQRRILWLMQGYLVAFLVIILFTLSALLSVSTGLSLFRRMAFYMWFAVYPVAVLLVLACFVIAIFFKGAFDPRLTIRRTAVYGALLIALTFLFAGVESTVSSELVARLGLPDSAGTWFGSGAAALAFGPLRLRLERWLRPALRLDDEDRSAASADATV